MKAPIEIWKAFLDAKPMQKRFTVAFEDLSLGQNVEQMNQSINKNQLEPQFLSSRLTEKFATPMRQSLSQFRSPESNLRSRFIDQNEEHEYQPENPSLQQTKNTSIYNLSQDNFSSYSKYQQSKQNYKMEYEKMLTKIEEQERQLVFIKERFINNKVLIVKINRRKE